MNVSVNAIDHTAHVQPAVDAIVAEIRETLTSRDNAKEDAKYLDTSDRQNACIHQILGLKVALGFMLSTLAGKTDESAFHAIASANEYLESLPR